MIKRLVIIFLIAGVAFAAEGFSPTLTSFTAGQVSGGLEGRADFPAYRSSCRTLENMFVYIEGPATRRPGTKYISSIPTSITYSQTAFDFGDIFFNTFLIGADAYTYTLTDNGDNTYTQAFGVAGAVTGFDGTYVYKSYFNNLYKYDTAFNLITSWQTNGLLSLSGVATARCDKSTGKVIVMAGSGQRNLHCLDSDGDELWNTTGTIGGFPQWQDMMFCEDGDIVAARMGNTATCGYRISVSDGSVLSTCTVSATNYFYDVAENHVTGDIIFAGLYGGTYGVWCFSSTLGDLKWGNEITIPYNKIEVVWCAEDGSVFVSGQRATSPYGTVHKYTSAGVYVSSYDCGDDSIVGDIIQVGPDSILVAGDRAENEDGHTQAVNKLSLDLEYQGGHDYGYYAQGYTGGGLLRPVVTWGGSEDVTVTVDANDVRLIPFEHSAGGSYVLGFSNDTLGFYRTAP